MVEGKVSMSSVMKSRSATWSKVLNNDYYGKISNSTTPYFMIRTNFFGTTVSNQQYAQIYV